MRNVGLPGSERSPAADAPASRADRHIVAVLDREPDGLAIGVLGELELLVDGRPARLTTGRLRTLLVMLAMSAGETVSVDRLAIGLWSDQPPDSVRRSLQTYLSRLRTAIGAKLIETRSAGVLLHIDQDNVDALRFERLLDRARQEQDTDSERMLLDAALGLWRGDPFTGVASRWLEATAAPRLTEQYLTALERRLDLDLDEGRHGELVARLADLTVRHPLREPLWARLLVALDRCGRRAEALERYEQVRVRIADELGADPGAELRRIDGQGTRSRRSHRPAARSVRSRSRPPCTVPVQRGRGHVPAGSRLVSCGRQPQLPVRGHQRSRPAPPGHRPTHRRPRLPHSGAGDRHRARSGRRPGPRPRRPGPRPLRPRRRRPSRMHWQQALGMLLVLGLERTEDGWASAADIRGFLAGLTASDRHG